MDAFMAERRRKMAAEGQDDMSQVDRTGRVDEDGNPLSSTFVDYLLPTATEGPPIEYGHVEIPGPGVGGYKGCGEGGAIGGLSDQTTPFQFVKDVATHAVDLSVLVAGPGSRCPWTAAVGRHLGVSVQPQPPGPVGGLAHPDPRSGDAVARPT